MKHKLTYAVVDEFGQIIAATITRWTAERLIEGIKAHNSLTSQVGSWSVEPLIRHECDRSNQGE